MGHPRHTEEQIIAALKEQEAGMKTTELCRKHGISDATFYKWKSKYGGLEISEARRLARKETMLLEVPSQGERPGGHAKLLFSEPLRDRMEEADRSFFERVAKGFEAIATAEPQRVRLINGAKTVDVVCAKIWEIVQPILPRIGRW